MVLTSFATWSIVIVYQVLSEQVSGNIRSSTCGSLASLGLVTFVTFILPLCTSLLIVQSLRETKGTPSHSPARVDRLHVL
jgi:hypothetical protein